MEIKTVNDATIVGIMKRYDAYTSAEVETQLTKLIDEGARNVVCDFAQTEYVASAGLRVLITVSKRLQKAGGQFALCSLKPYVLEVFEISGLNRIFKIYDSTELAIQSFQ